MAKRTKKAQPSAPADIAARRLEKRELEARGLTVNTDARTEEILSIARPDCFTLLLRPGKRPGDRCWMLEYGAVLWLEDLVRTAQGENAPERRPDFIRGSVEGAPGQNISQAMIDASGILAAVEANLPPAQMRLLFGLLRPDAALDANWRSVAARHSGETNAQAQGAAVRAAATSLLWVQDNIDRLVRERKERRMVA